MFVEHGFDNVTVDDIAAAAGSSPRTFFRYFATKDEVVLDYERRLQERLLVALRSRPADEGPVEALRQAYIETSHVEPAERERVLQVGRVLENAPVLRARVTGERIAEDSGARRSTSPNDLGARPDDARVRVIIASMGAVAEKEFRTWVRGGGKGNPAKRISEALALLESGLGQLDKTATAAGRKRK